MKKYVLKSVRILLIVLFVIVVLPFIFFSGKNVHISIDDVSSSLKNLSTKTYESVWEEPFFSFLQNVHKTTDAKFTLYIFEEDSVWNISDLPAKYNSNFLDSQDWLRFAWHAKNSQVSKDFLKSKENLFCTSFERTTNELMSRRLIPAERVRLQFFYATENEIDCVKKYATTLLTADDNRISYSLPEKILKNLNEEEKIDYENMLYEKTDVRIENVSILGILKSLIVNARDENFVLFTHEWALNKRTRMKIWMYCLFFWLYNGHFIVG